MGMKGRGKKAFGESDFLEVVRKNNTLKTSILAKRLKTSGRTIQRYMKSNPDVCVKAEMILEELSNLELTPILMNYENFCDIPIIKSWEGMLFDVTEHTRNFYIRGLYNICKHLKVHPKKLTLEECSELAVEMKKRYYADEPMIKGLAYSSIRVAIRSYFTLVHRISSEYISQLGVKKEALKGEGQFANQKVSKEVRKKLEEILRKHTVNYQEYLEALNLDKFMYYTGTRINASLQFSFEDHEYELNKEMWILTVVDKGKGEGIKWEKIFIGHALRELKEYLSERFDIPIDDLEVEVPKKVKYLFPSFVRFDSKSDSRKICNINKIALKESGLPYREFPPNHIWRHTFAQDFLSASEWNYELCASLGGWKSTGVLKKHYGEMSDEAKISGLRVSMGLPVKKKEIKLLKW